MIWNKLSPQLLLRNFIITKKTLSPSFSLLYVNGQ